MVDTPTYAYRTKPGSWIWGLCRFLVERKLTGPVLQQYQAHRGPCGPLGQATTIPQAFRPDRCFSAAAPSRCQSAARCSRTPSIGPVRTRHHGPRGVYIACSCPSRDCTLVYTSEKCSACLLAGHARDDLPDRRYWACRPRPTLFNHDETPRRKVCSAAPLLRCSTSTSFAPGGASPRRSVRQPLCRAVGWDPGCAPVSCLQTPVIRLHHGRDCMACVLPLIELPDLAGPDWPSLLCPLPRHRAQKHL